MRPALLLAIATFTTPIVLSVLLGICCGITLKSCALTVDALSEARVEAVNVKRK